MRSAAVLLVSSLIVFLNLPIVQAESLPSERLLPATTVGFAAIEDLDQLAEHWNQTQVGKLMADPVMKPFAEDLRRQFKQRWSRFDDRLGLTLDDLKGVPAGEIAVATIQPGRYQAAIAVLVDVTGNTAKAEQLLEKVSTSLVNNGAKRQTFEVMDTTIIVFELPEPSDTR